MKRSLQGLVFGALFLIALPAAAGHPTTVGERHPDWGYEWVAASRVLRADGSVKRGFGVDVRDHLEWQLQHGATDHGLEDGVPSQEQEFCSPRFWLYVSPFPYESQRFGSTLLLSEVAVAATIDEAIPGFDRLGNPVMLFPLSDGLPLHGSSPIPGYVLIPVDRMVYKGRVFCRSVGFRFWEGDDPPETGDRVVVIGPWTEGGVVRLGFVLTAALALIDGDNERLQWPFGRHYPDSPGSVSELQSRIDEAVSGGLFELTRSLISQEWGSPERRAFAESWERHHRDGCRVVEAQERPGFGVVPVRKTCSRSSRQRPRPETEEPAVAEQGGGAGEEDSAPDTELSGTDNDSATADATSPPD